MSLPIRHRNAASTRETILGAARQRFMLDGYDRAGLRAIAADAGVDPALICRYFGGKELLFAEVLASTGRDPMKVIAGDRASFGRRVAEALLRPADCDPDRLAFVQLAIRSSTSPAASKLVRERVESQFMVPFAAWIGGERAADKAWLAGSILMGAATMLAIGCTPADAAATDGMVDRLARALQRLVDDD